MTYPLSRVRERVRVRADKAFWFVNSRRQNYQQQHPERQVQPPEATPNPSAVASKISRDSASSSTARASTNAPTILA